MSIPSIETIKSWCSAFGIPFSILVIGLILGAIITIAKYSEIKKLFSDLTRPIAFISKWLRKKNVECEFEGILNTYAAHFNEGLTTPFLPECHVQWVNSGNAKSLIQPGKAIIRMSFDLKDHDLNLINAATQFVNTALIHKTKPFLKRQTATAIDLIITKDLIEKIKRQALTIFNNRFSEVDQESRDVYYKLEDIDESGLLKRVFLQELLFFGEALVTTPPRAEYEKEAEDFLSWVYDIATREFQEHAPLFFERNHLKVGLILIADEKTYLKFGIEPYIRWANRYSSNGIRTIYLLARNYYKSQIAKDVATKLLETECFEQLSKNITLKRVYNERPVTITCIPLRPEPTTIRQKAFERIESHSKSNTRFIATVEDVSDKSIQVDAYGLKVIIPKTELSSIAIPRIDLYFRPNLDIEVIPKSVDVSAQNIVLSCVGTQSDPKEINSELQDKLGQSISGQIIKIVSRDDFDTGIVIDLPNLKVKGFLPARKAMLSRFARLANQYKVGDSIKVRLLEFDAPHANIICDLPDLKDPWSNAQDFAVGQVVNGIVREIREAFLICEIRPGIEVRLTSRELTWPSDPQSAPPSFANFSVGQDLKGKLICFDVQKRLALLSLRQLIASPAQAFFSSNNNCKCDFKVKEFAPFGCIGTIGNNIRSFLPINEISWAYCSDPQDFMDVNAVHQTIVIGYDERFDNVIVSRKMAIPNNYEHFRSSYNPGDTIEGKIVSCQNSCVLVSLTTPDGVQAQASLHKNDISRLIHFSKETIALMFDANALYNFIISDFRDSHRIIHVSRTSFLSKHLDNVEYGDIISGRVVSKSRKGFLVYSNQVEGFLTPKAKQSLKIGDNVNFIIARKEGGYADIELA
jgi:ribosomal protein S1